MKTSEIIKTWKKRSRTKAIKEHCLECSGGTTPEVTLCSLTDCPLWGYRFGNAPGGPTFRTRMDTARSSKPEEFEEAYSHLGENTDGKES
jgi:hypothetical protein